MASPFKIERNPFGIGDNIFKVEGLSEEELYDLKNMSHENAILKLLDMLDERNDELGTKWWRSNNVWSCWFDNEFAYVKLVDPD